MRHHFFLEIRTRRMFQPSNHPAGKERPAPHRKWESGGPASAQEWGSEPGLCDPPPQPLPGELCGEGQSPGPSSAPRYLWDSPCAEACPGWSVVLSVKGGAAQISPPCLAGQTPHGFPLGYKCLRLPEVTWAVGTSQQSHPPLPAPPPQAVLGLCSWEGVEGWFSLCLMLTENR